MLGFIGVIVIVFRRGDETKNIKTKGEKRVEIITTYKKALQESLKDFDKDDKVRKDKKIMLLREYSYELSRNIFFDNDEIKEIILELSGE